MSLESDSRALSHAVTHGDRLHTAAEGSTPRMLVTRTTFVAAALCSLSLAQQEGQPLRDLDAPGVPYRTPRAGEGVRASLFGEPLELAPRDRRSLRVWQLGVAAALDADDGTVPLPSLYFWEHPDDGHLVRAFATGVYNQATWARGDGSGAETMLTFESYTPPWATGELVDGEVRGNEKLFWGYVRAGIGIGTRSRVAPLGQENMFAANVLLEPGLLYFGRDDKTDPTYQLPDSTPELRLRGLVRYDGIERNLLVLPHAGVAFGADAVLGYRIDADDWGLPGTEVHSGTHWYAEATGYAFGITGVPGLSADAAERNRVYASLHGGAGDHLDRFSAQRVGGGPDLRGTEYETTVRPWLPGAALGEFFPDHYAIGSIGYRRELSFFAHLDVGGTIAWLDRDVEQPTGRERVDDTLTAVSVRLSSGFIGRTVLLIGYGHNFDVVRDGQRGGDELTLLLTGLW